MPAVHPLGSASPPQVRHSAHCHRRSQQRHRAHKALGWVSASLMVLTVAVGVVTSLGSANSMAGAAGAGTYTFGGYTFSTAGDSPQAQAVIQAAAQWLGRPYVYGGGGYYGPTGAASYCSGGIVTSPGSSNSGMGNPCSPAFAAQSGQPGFDCSGLVMYAMAQVGIYLPHYSGSWGDFGDVEYAGGFTTNVNALEPGDLVFFEGPTDPQHVGIYIGNDHMIDAYDTGTLVQIDTVSSFIVPFVGGGPAWQVQEPPQTTTTLSVSPSTTITTLQTATLTATVSPAPNGGTVTFDDQFGDIGGCVAVPVISGQATCTAAALPLWSDALTANYLGDASSGGSMGSVTQVVTPPPAHTTSIPLPNGTIDYCRQVGAGPNRVASYLSCTVFNGTSFASTVTSGIEDWGYTNGSEQWVRGPGNTVDYCHQLGPGPNNVGSYVECTPFDGTSFGATVSSGLVDWGYTNGSEQWVTSSDGTVDYCRQVGAGPNWVGSYLSCTPFNGTTFTGTIFSGIEDWGYQNGSAQWVPGPSATVDYCRQGGDPPDNVGSYVECTPFNGTSFTPTVTSGILDLGYTNGSEQWSS